MSLEHPTSQESELSVSSEKRSAPEVMLRYVLFQMYVLSFYRAEARRQQREDVYSVLDCYLSLLTRLTLVLMTMLSVTAVLTESLNTPSSQPHPPVVSAEERTVYGQDWFYIVYQDLARHLEIIDWSTRAAFMDELNWSQSLTGRYSYETEEVDGISEVWVGNEFTGEQRLLAEGTIGSQRISPDGRFVNFQREMLIASSYEHIDFTIRPVDGEFSDIIIDDELAGLAWTSNSFVQTLFFNEDRTLGARLIDPQTGETYTFQAEDIPDHSGVSALDMNGERSLIVIQSGSNHIYAYDVASGQYEYLADGETMSISSNGRYVLFRTPGGYGFYLLDRDTGRTLRYPNTFWVRFIYGDVLRQRQTSDSRGENILLGDFIAQGER